MIFNLLVTFGVSGLWHGANWTYLVWGCLNGVYLVTGWFTKDVRNRVMAWFGLHEHTLVRKTIMCLCTFVLIDAAWIVFRAKSLGDAWYIVSHLASNWNVHQIGTEQFLLRQLPVAIAGLLILEVGQLCSSRLPNVVRKLPLAPRWAIYAGFVMGVLMFGVYRNT